MRLFFQYVIPLVALITVLILVLARRNTLRGTDESLVSGPMLVIVLAISGAIGVFAIVLGLSILGVI